ncbi:tyrosine-protein kinase [Streptococcus hyovaginalis]|uniref:tyrosine-protein kinase n=1 Tax=Streptococcus hyovaginalis TaxID=149015 RepID=UPI001478F5FD|nr:tyrosine-protein kinase [Streptococcus hyovaginalis]
MPKLELNSRRLVDIGKTEEYFNSIRTNIQFSGSDLKTIVVSSVQPGEGKSTTSTSLAVSFANAGFKTLLIEADVRNSVMTGTFIAHEKYLGLTSYLTGNARINDVFCETDVDNLMLIPSGQMSPNPTSLLQNKYFAQLLQTARDVFDYVIIDSPPIGLVIDSAIIASQSDASLLVVEAGLIKRRFVQKAVEQLSQSGKPFLGVILNKVDTTKDSYGVYGNYGAYGNYGKKQDTDKSKKRSRVTKR